MPELNGGPADAQVPDAQTPGGAWAAGVSSAGPAAPAPDGEPPGSPPPPSGKRGNRRGRIALVLLIVIGVCVLAGGGTALALELTRHATKAEAQAAASAEVSTRWERRPAGQIFPAQLTYVDDAQSVVRIDRAGIAPPAACAQAADPAMAQVLVREGCVTVLRATYVDSTGTFVITLGIAVMRSTAAAGAAAEQLGAGMTAGLRAVSVPGTTASSFGDAQRQVFDLFPPGQTPYIYLDAGGFTDGRIRTSGIAEPALSDLDTNVLDDLVTIMTQHKDACQEKDIRC